MLKSLAVRGFKSLIDVDPIEMAPLTVFFGPNAAGKSNLLDAILLLSRLATAKTVTDAFDPVRGLALEQFSFPEGEGLPGLLAQERATCRFEAELVTAAAVDRYRVEIAIAPRTGALTVEDEFLAALTPAGETRGKPVIERHGAVIRIHRTTTSSHPREEPAGSNHTQVSNPRYSGKEYAPIERARDLLSSFRSYYLDPRLAMRRAQGPREVDDVGPLGEHIASFLYRLRGEKPKVFDAIRRTFCTLIPSIEDLIVDVDSRLGVLNLEIRERNTPFSSRIVSEGTLRVLALICVATNPWGGPLIAFEEPENGVHPRRIELIAEILGSLAFEAVPAQQVILTTHSPRFCNAVIRLARKHPDEVCMVRTVRDGGRTRFLRFEPDGPLLTDPEIRTALTTPDENGVFEGLLLRGLLDG